ncbi:ABC transporter ATP-binding protein [Sinomonas terrae]|uniref:ABC transporter ATP-binding protein n=1 Tax=Sinomonas terrae TaxID=2908838 RepID=A0ABS9TVZ2_9MICC|nr:ABC transporter ATP-binding protein [Sinomonas terrae]MCH6468589.1 ABC transporter ATP-binding protein [Sinomonas terrae]
MPSRGETMLSFAAVGCRYSRARWVFRNASFSIAAGSTMAILGPNGSGKTTLIRCAAGLLSPREGSVTRNAPPGYVPQSHGSAFAYTAFDMVLMGRAQGKGWFQQPNSSDRAAAGAAMERVGISGLADRLLPTLSGGERQLVLIARAMATGSPLLILDEPSTGLDLKNQARVLGLLRDLRQAGMSLLLSTHHPDHARAVADQVAIVQNGGVECGSAPEMLTESRLSALYGVPVSAVDYLDAAGRPVQTIVTGLGEPTNPVVHRPVGGGG